MKTILITFLSLSVWVLAYPSRSTTLPQKNKATDTLSLLQGLWDFNYLMMPGKRSTKEKYFANELVIKKTEFTMYLADGIPFGRIIPEEKFKFRFITGEDKLRPPTHNRYGDMEIYKCTEKELILIQRNQQAESFFRKQKGPCDVLFVYKKVE